MGQSKIAEAIKLSTYPVAVLRAEDAPEGCLQFQPGGKGGCLIGFVLAASKGKTAAFSEATTPCPGGRAGLGFCRLPERIDYFLSVGEPGGREGEFYKQSPEIAKCYREKLPNVKPAKYLVFKPLDFLSETEAPDAVIFLVTHDQLSGLVTLANYDQTTQDAVQIKFGAGCAQAVLYALKEQETGGIKCTIGLTDPSSRKAINSDLLSFSIPYHRFLQC